VTPSSNLGLHFICKLCEEPVCLTGIGGHRYQTRAGPGTQTQGGIRQEEDTPKALFFLSGLAVFCIRIHWIRNKKASWIRILTFYHRFKGISKMRFNISSFLLV